MKLLIVDDSLIIRQHIQRILGAERFSEVRLASDGATAVTEALELRPDVITMDITMPHLDGLAAVERITGAYPRTKILIISALADKHTAVEAVKRGAEGFLLKPFTAEALQQAFDEIIDE